VTGLNANKRFKARAFCLLLPYLPIPENPLMFVILLSSSFSTSLSSQSLKTVKATQTPLSLVSNNA